MTQSGITPGCLVVAAGEGIVRQVVSVDGNRALCKRMGKSEQAWFPLESLKVEKPRGPLRVLF